MLGKLLLIFLTTDKIACNFHNWRYTVWMATQIIWLFAIKWKCPHNFVASLIKHFDWHKKQGKFKLHLTFQTARCTVPFPNSSHKVLWDRILIRLIFVSGILMRSKMTHPKPPSHNSLQLLFGKGSMTSTDILYTIMQLGSKGELPHYSRVHDRMFGEGWQVTTVSLAGQNWPWAMNLGYRRC